MVLITIESFPSRVLHLRQKKNPFSNIFACSTRNGRLVIIVVILDACHPE